MDLRGPKLRLGLLQVAFTLWLECHLGLVSFTEAGDIHRVFMSHHEIFAAHHRWN